MWQTDKSCIKKEGTLASALLLGRKKVELSVSDGYTSEY